MRGKRDGSMEKELRKLLEEGQARIELMQKEIKTLPKGELLIKKSGGYTLFYKKYGNKEQGIGSDRELKRMMARKCVLRNEIAKSKSICKLLEQDLKVLKKIKDKNRKALHRRTYERILELFPEEDYVYSERQREWMNGGSMQNDLNRDDLKYVTRSGIRVRSKSERTIADLLTENSIAFRYEAEFVMESGSFFPDFTIMRRDGKLVLWEHMGLMDDPEYFRRACNKIEKYRREGFSQHTDLICTYEEDIASPDRLHDIIERYLM